MLIGHKKLSAHKKSQPSRSFCSQVISFQTAHQQRIANLLS